MAFDKTKGLFSIASSYSSATESYSYVKLDQFIARESYSVAPDQRQDLDSYVNANGKLKRNVLEHYRTKVEFNLKYMDNTMMNELLQALKTCSNLKDCSEREHKVRVRYFNPYTNDYDFMFCYYPDIEFTVGGTWDGKIHYLPTRVAFIEY